VCARELEQQGNTYIVQVRPTEDGLVFQQLLWGDEVRSLKDLNIEHVAVSDAELQLAMKIIEQGAVETYDPNQFENAEKKRVLAAIDAKIEGKQIVSPAEEFEPAGGQVIDLMEALRASLSRGGTTPAQAAKAGQPAEAEPVPAKPRKTVKRAEATPAAAPAKRARR
jgi:DNA end-binding protein Ku